MINPFEQLANKSRTSLANSIAGPSDTANPLAVISKDKPKVDVFSESYVSDLLKMSGFDSILVPSNIEIQYVRGLFDRSGIVNIAHVSYDTVDEIARSEFLKLNSGLAELTKKYSNVKMPQMLAIIQHLTKEVDKAQIIQTWEDVQNVKPTVGQKIIALFNKDHLSHELNKRFNQALQIISGSAATLENEIIQIEKNLREEYKSQEENIRDLENSFEKYFDAFKDLRRSFIFVVILEDFYRRGLDAYKASINTNDLMIQHRLSEYESIYSEIQNKKAIIHKALLQLPVMSMQNKALITASRQTMRDINNTLVSTMPMIRGNITQIVAAIRVEHGLNGSKAAQNLESNLSTMSMQLMGDVAKRAASAASEGRLKDAQNISNLVSSLKNFKEEMNNAAIENNRRFSEAEDLMIKSTAELKQILGA